MKKIMKIVLKIILVFVLALTAGVYFYSQRPEFGRTPTGKRLERIRQSPHYYNGRFWSITPVEKPVETSQFQATMRFLFGGTPERLVPAEPMVSRKTDLRKLDLQQDTDHWDHLDYPTLMALKPKIKKIVVPLGIGEHFEYWGFDLDIITEEDWYTPVKLSEQLTVHILPAQHFTGRFLNANQSEACAFAFITPQRKVFYSGDGGYTKEFKEFGNTFGGFDLAILENGQYNKDWPKIHMNPKETARAGEDLKAKTVLPCHGGKFALARHPWDEPYTWLAEESKTKPYRLLTPRIGEAAVIGDSNETFGPWWKEMK